MFFRMYLSVGSTWGPKKLIEMEAYTSIYMEVTLLSVMENVSKYSVYFCSLHIQRYNL